MAQQIIHRIEQKKADVFCYNAVTTAKEVNTTLHDIVKKLGPTKNIWVISGTHGTAAGTVDAGCAQKDFKDQDRDSANVTSRLIHVKDYHLLAPNVWKELSGKPGETNVMVLAWCFSYQWFSNTSDNGNNGKL
jgi:hypothetical protein